MDMFQAPSWTLESAQLNHSAAPHRGFIPAPSDTRMRALRPRFGATCFVWTLSRTLRTCLGWAVGGKGYVALCFDLTTSKCSIITWSQNGGQFLSITPSCTPVCGGYKCAPGSTGANNVSSR